ncbi:hypothetical protein [Chitinophaga sp.]|uniref:hypothetical protein n=1 Tax=Chitinophaga sp. TaxID=1869181 RepID=UPI0031D0A7AA
MKQTNNPTQKKTLTLNKVTVSVFNNNVVNSKNGGKFAFGQDTTTSVNCVTTVTL